MPGTVVPSGFGRPKLTPGTVARDLATPLRCGAAAFGGGLVAPLKGGAAAFGGGLVAPLKGEAAVFGCGLVAPLTVGAGRIDL